MCLHPNQIKNPLYGDKYTLYKNTWDKYIKIPCGTCAECIAIKQMEYCQKILMESKDNHMFMLTLTYKEAMIPRYSTSKGVTFKYADKNDFTQMCKRIEIWKKRGEKYTDIPKFRYFGVCELGGKKARPHIHVIIIVKKKDAPTYNDILTLENKFYWLFRNEWKRNTAAGTKKPNYEPLFEYHETWTRDGLKRNYDLHYINPSTTENGVQDAAFYVLKYLIKYQEGNKNQNDRKRQQALKLNLTEKTLKYNKEKDEYEETKEVSPEYYEVWNKIKSKAFYSKKFGLDPTEYEITTPFGDKEKEVRTNVKIERYIKDCIEVSKLNKLEYPVFINTINGNTFPLCQYYKDKFMTEEDIEFFFNPDIERNKTIQEIKQREEKGKRIADIVLQETIFEQFLKLEKTW